MINKNNDLAKEGEVVVFYFVNYLKELLLRMSAL